MRNLIANFFSVINVFFPKNKKKISIWGRKKVYDNSISILEYIINCDEYKNHTIICHFYHKEKFAKYSKEQNIKIVKNPLISLYHLFTSCIILHEQGMSIASFKGCRRQIIMYIGHGQNYIEKDSTFMKARLKKYSNYFMSISHKLMPMMNLQIGAEEKNTFICGYPRNDVFYKKNNCKKLLGLEKYGKIIVFTPTYRTSDEMKNDTVKDLPLLDENNIYQINDCLNKYNIVLIIKPHPIQKQLSISSFKLSNIMVVTNKELSKLSIKTYELLSVSDALISDFSSIISDYLLLNKPIGYILNDFEEYKKGRGIFLLDEFGKIERNPDEIPLLGEKIITEDSLYGFIEDIANNDDKYLELRKKYLDICQVKNDGHNTKILLDHLHNKINS